MKKVKILSAKPPALLETAGKELWRNVCTTFELEDWQFSVLFTVCRAWDKVLECETILVKEGLLVVLPNGIRTAHPALRILDKERASFYQGWGKLGIDAEPPQLPGRPT